MIKLCPKCKELNSRYPREVYCMTCGTLLVVPKVVDGVKLDELNT